MHGPLNGNRKYETNQHLSMGIQQEHLSMGIQQENLSMGIQQEHLSMGIQQERMNFLQKNIDIYFYAINLK